MLVQRCPGCLLPTIRHFENRRGEGPGDEVALRLYTCTAIQKDCRFSFKLLSKKSAGQEGLALTENFDTKHAGFSVENKAQNR